ncbi:MAG: MFS transporter [Clostridia bacterium]|nr:MFS transporter [Clostridia bacterium]
MKKKNPFSIYSGLPGNIYILFVSRVVNFMGSFIMPLMALILTRKIGLSKSDAGLLSTIAMLTQAPFLFLGGRLVDKIGSKKVIVIFNFLGAFVYFACGFLKPSLSTAALIIAAMDLYVMAAPAFNVIVADIAPSSMIQRSYSLMYLGLNLGMAVGPMLGGLLFNSHLNLLFFLDALTTLLATALVLFFVKDKKGTPEPSAPAKGEGAEPVRQQSLFEFFKSNAVLPLFAVVMLIYNLCYIQFSFLLPLQTADIFQSYGVEFFSLLLSMNSVVVIIFTPLLTSGTQAMHPLKVIFTGGLLYCVSFALFAVNRFTPVFVVAVFILTIGEIMISININTFIAQRTPEAYMGRVNSILTIATGTGTAVGPVITGSLLIYLNYRRTWLLVSALMLCGALAMYRLLRHLRRAESQG